MGLRGGFPRKTEISKTWFWQIATNGFIFFCISFLQHTLAENRKLENSLLTEEGDFLTWTYSFFDVFSFFDLGSSHI